MHKPYKGCRLTFSQSLRRLLLTYHIICWSPWMVLSKGWWSRMYFGISLKDQSRVAIIYITTSSMETSSHACACCVWQAWRLLCIRCSNQHNFLCLANYFFIIYVRRNCFDHNYYRNISEHKPTCLKLVIFLCQSQRYGGV